MRMGPTRAISAANRGSALRKCPTAWRVSNTVRECITDGSDDKESGYDLLYYHLQCQGQKGHANQHSVTRRMRQKHANSR